VTLRQIATRLSRIGSNSASKLLCLLCVAAAVSFAVAYAVAHGQRAQHEDLLRPAQQTPRKTTQLSKETLHPTIAGDGSVVKVGKRYEIVAAIQDTDLAYRLSSGHFTVRALIVGGPTGFPCAWLGLRSEDGAAPRMACQVPSTIRVVSGLQASMVLAIDAPTEVNALPVSAVIGAAQQGQVILVEANGEYQTRQVDIGSADDQWVQIKHGLLPGERVLLVPTQSDLGSS